MKQVTREEEVERFIRDFGEDRRAEMMAVLERQFAVLHNRAQVLLGICGIVITTTGFSGRLIAGTSPLAQGCVIGGVTLVLLALAMVVLGVLHLRWLTQQLGDDTRSWLRTSLAYRDLKTNYYRAGIVFMLFGLALYVLAIALMLAYPTAAPPLGGR